ncbi:zf-HC2 domain-containing protein [Clostridium vincentii]|uniref:Putative zinc-finger domain-containing protein n=1 Tax=Clostridium vincentii TaxID=52704 RepID=A0A2T0BHV4_9CLOT|nr:zf-HC2 domain-containing protein [Clostridium vincentii]PRR83479.1 hypothetical protein CLVI_10280 [Clostridium vincentii]
MNDEKLCYIVRDLLPSYVDCLTSETSNDLVKEHIEKCEECKSIYEKMTHSIQKEKTNNKKEISFLKKYRKVLSITIVTASLVVAALSAGMAYFAWLFFTGGNPKVQNIVSEYGEWEEFLGYSNLDVFPIVLPDSASDVDYYCYCRDTLFDPKCQVYLTCTYDTQDYNNEVKRLSEIDESMGGKTQEILYDENCFSYPAYVAVNSSNYCYEYALLLEDEDKIVYVFTQNIKKEDVIFSKNYLAQDYMKENSDKTNDKYNIYMFRDDKIDGWQSTYGKYR